MAKTPAERMAEMRARKAVRAAQSEKELLSGVFSRPFFEWLAERGDWLNIDMPLDNAGLDAPAFHDDTGGHSKSGYFEESCEAHGRQDRIPTNSLQRAELIVDSWLDAASELAGAINQYKLAELNREIEARHAEAIEHPSDDVEGKKASKAHLDRLKAIRSELWKPMRRTIPAIRSRSE